MTLPGGWLQQALESSAGRHGERTAVEETGPARISYAELDRLAGRVAARLTALGIGPGDRVGIHLRKSIDSVAAIFGILKTGAAYVPVDSTAPATRNAYILADCGVRAVFVESAAREALEAEMEALGATPALLDCRKAGGGEGLRAALEAEPSRPAPATPPGAAAPPDRLAYILYTSGSTGRPKGVMITHRNALCFVEWCSELFQPGPDDRFSSHAPFHFDLSILDIYVPLRHGATLVLIDEETAREPIGLADFIGRRRLTVWYSTPSILSMLLQYGHLERQDCSSLRFVLFAGEVFPVRNLRRLTELLPGARYFNLYGPTETNVCTYHEIPLPVPPERTTPYPIGVVCPHYQARVENEAGEAMSTWDPGELLVSGPGVTPGYWNLPDRSATMFRTTEDGRTWYRTGDLVVDPGDGCFNFLGRKDRMVKRRGYRVELGEIESALYRNTGIREVAVLARDEAERGVRIHACVSPRPGVELSVIALKQFCMTVLPAYMVPDVFKFLPELPHTSTDKIDYQRLRETI